MKGKPGLSATAQRTGAATGGPGSINNTGVMYLNYVNGRSVARSVYRRQVEQIFPFELVGRDAELAELAAFCTKPDGRPYAWWQGPAWAGKSALMAYFVLHPPVEVRAVSFFITARFADQSDRTAFLEVVLEQLAEVADKPVPDIFNESNKQAWFVELLADAAAVCAENDKRLVLLVDGLDEDRGVTSSTEAHSIAALLPADPPEGVRVIVAGRPNPPVPADVPAWHPLRDETVVRALSVSPYAQMIRDDAERELDYLLDQGGLGRKLLGLVTVARGGLSLDDLTELSGESPRTVDRTLRSVLGRTFRGRVNRWRSSAPPVFVLAHEELQQSAQRSLSRDELAGFLGELHRWADDYRQRGWPPQTPEYLLRGYYRLLVATGDAGRMTGMATDRARLDRMLDVSGGDAAALAEITAVQGFVGGLRPVNLAALFDLAISRDQLFERNKTMPPELPVAWARPGNLPRAEALARSITSEPSQTQALAGVATELAKAGQVDRARQLLLQAEVAARSVAAPEARKVALASTAEALAVVGDLDQAEAAARAMTDAGSQALVLTAIAERLAQAGAVGPARQFIQDAVVATGSVTDWAQRAARLHDAAAVLAKIGDADQAEVMARSITDTAWRARALAHVAEVLAKSGDLDRVRRVFQQAETAARSATAGFWQASALADTARALAEAGEVGRARELIEQATVAARSATPLSLGSAVLVTVVEALTKAGDVDQAEAVARSMGGGAFQAQALIHVAEALTHAGDADRAWQVVDRAETVARSGAAPGWQGRTMAAVTEALAAAGDTAHAEIVARSVTHPSWRARALARVAEALAVDGDACRARQVLQQADAAARSLAPFWQSSALIRVARAWAAAGHADLAEAAARFIADPGSQAEALVSLAGALARAGHADLAEDTARSLSEPSRQAQALACVAEALAEAGDVIRARQVIQQAEGAVSSFTDVSQHAQALAGVARAWAEVGDVSRARQVVEQATVAAGSVTDPTWKVAAFSAAAEALASVVKALARAGDLDQAEATARAITDQYAQAEALASVAEALVKAGGADRAEAVARSVTDPRLQATPLAAAAEALAEVPGTFEPRDDVVISKSPAGDRLQRMLASILTETSNYLAALPLLARIEPSAVVKAARDISARPRG